MAWLLAARVPGRRRALHAEPTAVRDIRIATHGDVTRVVIDLNRRVSFRHLSLDEPPRLAIDLPEVAWEVPRLNGRRTVGLVKGLRFGRFRPGVARIVLDVAQPFEISKVFELPPGDGQGHRIVTDLVELRGAAAGRGQRRRAVGGPAAAPGRAGGRAAAAEAGAAGRRAGACW